MKLKYYINVRDNKTGKEQNWSCNAVQPWTAILDVLAKSPEYALERTYPKDWTNYCITITKVE